MRIVIAGIGKIGSKLTQALCGEGYDVTVIDKDPEVIDKTVNANDVNGIAGNALNLAIQKDAGVGKADVFIAVTGSDEINMLSSIVAKQVGVKHTVARIRDPEYSKQFIVMLDTIGLDCAVNPELECAAEISRLLRHPSAVGMDTFAGGKVDLTEIVIDTGSPLCGMPLYRMRTVTDARVLVCAIKRGDSVIIPKGSTVIEAGDRVTFTADHTQVENFFSDIINEGKKLRDAILIGGGRISYYLARKMTESGMTVKIVERDENRCKELSELLPKAEIIKGDGTNTDVLDEADFDSADACIALTGIDEENIIISMFARHAGIKKVITKINKDTMAEMFGSVAGDTVISPKKITSDRILGYVRSFSAQDANGISTLYKIADGMAEALEFVVTEDSKAVGKTLTELKIKPNIIVSCIIRGNETIIPGGNDMIMRGDKVIIVSSETKLTNIDDILE